MLQLKTYLIKERVAVLKLSDTYDIFDPETGAQVGQAREELPTWAKVLKLFLSKQLLPTSVTVYDAHERPVLRIRRGVPLLRAKVTIQDADGQPLGYFKSKIFSIGGGFSVYGTDDTLFAQVKGDWKGWNFRFLTSDGQELGTVAKKWAGLGKELFTSADNYVIALNDEATEMGSALLLAAGLAIDTVYKETS